VAVIKIVSGIDPGTLAGDINSAVTSLDVGSGEGAGFPAIPFKIAIDGETMLVTGKATDTFTVTRGYDGTTAAAHVTGATVVHVHSAEDFPFQKDDTTGKYVARDGLEMGDNEIWWDAVEAGDRWGITVDSSELRLRYFNASVGGSGVTYDLLAWDEYVSGGGVEGNVTLRAATGSTVFQYSVADGELQVSRTTRFGAVSGAGAYTNVAQALTTKQFRNIYVGTSAPGSPLTGDVWIDTT